MKLKIVFLDSHTFGKRELLSVFKKRDDIKLITLAIPSDPSAELVQRFYGQLKPYLPAIVFSINDAGYDVTGELHRLIVQSGSYQINWYHDFPFFDTLFKGRPYPLSNQRIDFASEESFVPLLHQKGFHAYFLPLATDLSYFNTDHPRIFERDISFVGNSSLELMDFLITEKTEKELQRFPELILQLKNLYYNNPTINLQHYLLQHNTIWANRTTIPPEQFVFTLEWLIGYFYRRDFIVQIARRFQKQFTLFGDAYWQRFIDPSLVSTDACYYDNLCRYYRTTKININVNRIQIQTSFTQRPFDCKASGAFFLTDKRKNNSHFFITDGPNKEIVEFDSLSHCIDLIRYYLLHEEEREKIAEAGKEKVLHNHTYDQRVEEILCICKKQWGI